MNFIPVVFVAILFASCHSSPKIQILNEQQGKFVFSNYQFIHEHWAQPKIGELYRQEKLGEISKAHPEEWDLQTALCNWTNAQWAPGNPDPYPLCNGVSILADIRSGKTKGFCGQYAYLFADALKALGYFDVRYVELESKGHAFHFTTELWSDRWQKWIVVDPFFDVSYSYKEGIPLSALELHEVAAGRKPKPAIHLIERRTYQPSSDHSTDLYYSMAISLRNDLAGLTSPLTVNDRLRMFLHFDDPHLSGWKPTLHYENQSDRIEDFDYTCNQVTVHYETDESKGVLRCSFEDRNTIPHFKTFLVSVDGQDWIPSSGGYQWKLNPGENSLKVVGLNAFNHFSKPAVLRVKFIK